MKPGKDYIGVGVGAFIVNDRNEFLMLLRAKGSKVEPGTWMIPGGKVDFNEKMEDAVKREIKEEIGVDLEVVEPVRTNDHMLTEQHWVTTTFLCRIKSGEPRILEPHKHDGIKWFKMDEMPENLSIASANSLKAYMEKYKK
jgi:ADP-ribose pyrophosphatase